MILQSKVVYVRKRWMKCQHCNYEWLSETKVTPETKKKRVCCSKCRSSITVTFFDNDSVEPPNPNMNPNPNLVKSVKPKSVQEFREISDPETSIDYRIFTEIQKIARQNETEIIKILDDLDNRDPLPPISEQQNKIWDEKMKHMTYGQKFMFMLSILRETFQKHYDKLNGAIPFELVVHFERCLDRQRIYAGFLHEMEVYELKKAQESDRRNLHKKPKPKKERSRKIDPKRRRLKLKC